MRAWGAVSRGMGRVVASPFILLAFWLLNLLVALPAAWIVQEAIRARIGKSGYYKRLTEGFDMEWFGLYQAKTDGMAATFTPTHSGVGGFVDNFEGFITGAIFKSPWPILALAGLFGLLWLTLLGGAVERYAGRGPSFAPLKFVSSGARYLFRYLRLTLLSAPLYVAVLWFSYRLMESMKQSMIDVTVEGTFILYSMLIWLTAGFLLTLIHAIFGFAKVAIVLDERRSAFLAALRGLAFVALHPAKTMGMYYAILLLGALGAIGYSFVAPGAGADSVAKVVWAFALGQIYLLFKLTMRMSLLAGQVALYKTHGLPTAPEPDPLQPDASDVPVAAVQST